MANYATALDFINQFGVHSSAEFLDTSENRDLTDVCLSDLAKYDSDISYTLVECSSESVRAGQAAIRSINRYLTDAEAEVNSYLISRYTLPISAESIAQSPIRRITCDIARYLASASEDMMSEIIMQRYKDCIKWLKEVSNGNAQLSVKDQISKDDAAGTAGIKYKTGSKVDGIEDY